MGTRSIGNGRSGSWRRLVLRTIGHPWFSTAIWSLFLVMSLIMVLHNVVLQAWGVGTFASITARIERMGQAGMFNSSPLVDAEGKPSFLQYARMPVGRFMHILPAGLWSVIAPLQLSPSFRAKHRTAHRRLGRLFMFMSVIMSIGIVPIVRSGASKFEHSALMVTENMTPCRCKEPITPDGEVFDNLEVLECTMVIVCGAYFFVVGLIAVREARNKKFASHRVWMLRHVAMGYSVHMQRLLGILSYWIYPLVVPGYTDHTEEGSRKRTTVFAVYFATGVVVTTVSMEVWLRFTSPSGKVMPLEEEEERRTVGAKAD